MADAKGANASCRLAWAVATERELLAVLGRGIQWDGGRWFPTPDLEMYRLVDGRPRHSARPLPPDPASPMFLVGGGALNVDAAAEWLRREPRDCVLGFAGPSPYLQRFDGAQDGPSESEVMSDEIARRVPSASVTRWSGAPDVPTNTAVEVRNVLDHARRAGYSRVRFLSVSVHLPRVALWAQRVARVEFTLEASETVLLLWRPQEVGRIARLHASSAYRRTVLREQLGIEEATRLSGGDRANGPTASPDRSAAGTGAPP